MVLSAPAAHDPVPPREAEWVPRVALALRLAKAGILIRVDHATPERLGDLVRGLIGQHPDLDVITELGALEEAAEGSVLVLIARPEHADALNLGRPLFSRRKLKVVLWCDHETSVALAQGAPDFFDGISHHEDCPPGPVPPHAVAGFRCAVEAGALGVVWRGAGKKSEKGRASAALSAAFPGQKIDDWIDPGHDSLPKIPDTREGWFGCLVGTLSQVRHVRWAMAEAKRRGRAVIVSPSHPCPGFWPVHDRLMPLVVATSTLRSAGSRRPGALAALTGLEEEAVELARVLLAAGASEDDLRGLLQGAADPGAALAREANAKGLLNLDEVIRWAAPPPVLRALATSMRGETRAVIQEIGRRLANGEALSAEEVGLWAALRTDNAKPKLRALDGEAQAFLIEAILRGGASASARVDLAQRALEMGEPGAAAEWPRSVAKSPLNIGRHREIRWIAEGLQASGLAAQASWLLRDMREARAGIFMAILGAVSFITIIMSLIELSSAEPSLLLLIAWLVVPSFGIIAYFVVFERAESDAAKASRLAAAENLAETGAFDEALEKCEALMGLFDEEQPLSRAALRLQGHALVEKGEDKRAEGVLREAMKIEARIVGKEHPFYVSLLPDYAAVLARTGRAREAEVILRALLGPREDLPPAEEGLAPPSLDLAFSAPPPLSPEQRARARRLLAEAWITQGRYAEAEHLLQRAVAQLDPDLPPSHAEHRRTLLAQGRVLFFQGRAEQAEIVLRRALALAEEHASKRHPDIGKILGQVALVEHRLGRPGDAAAHARRALDILGQAPIAEAEKALIRGELTPLTGPAIGS